MDFVSLKKFDRKEFSIIRRYPYFKFTLTTTATLLLASAICYGYELERSIGCLAIALSLTVITALILLQKTIIQESVLIFPLLGVQLTRTTALGTKSGIHYVPMSSIKSVVINETIRKQHVIIYLTLILRHPDNNGRTLVPLFQETLPKLEVLREIYQEIYKSLKDFRVD